MILLNLLNLLLKQIIDKKENINRRNIKRQLMHSIITSIINDGLLTSVVNKISYTIHKIQHTITHIQKERENKIVKKTPTQTQQTNKHNKQTT